MKVRKRPKIRNRYNRYRIPIEKWQLHNKTSQTRAKRSAFSQQVTTGHQRRYFIGVIHAIGPLSCTFSFFKLNKMKEVATRNTDTVDSVNVSWSGVVLDCINLWSLHLYLLLLSYRTKLRVHGAVCSLWLWYFPIILTYYFWIHV